jgi:phage major head subunit gpT-like protein
VGFLPNDYLDASKSSQYCITIYQERRAVDYVSITIYQERRAVDYVSIIIYQERRAVDYVSITIYQESEGIPHIMPSKLRRGPNHPNTASLS